MSSNFEAYAVFVPGSCEGITSGYEIVWVLALNETDAIKKACADYYSTGAREGTYLVTTNAMLRAYDVGEERVPSILAEVSLP